MTSQVRMKYENTTGVITQTKYVFHESLAHRGSFNQHSTPLEPSCSALISLCFLVHRTGM